MRLIGHLANESAARTFGDYLFVEGIENRVELQPPDGWGIWVNDEDKLQEAARLLSDFRENPSDPRYRSRAKSAADLRAEQEKSEEAWRKKLRDRRHLFRPLTSYGLGVITLGLILFSVVVFFLSGFGEDWGRVHYLFISEMVGNTLPEVRHGQIWRVLTPIFIHGGFLHIIFNMLWLRDLGSMIEGRQSSWHLLALVVVIGTCSNLGEYFIQHNPVFGGMSGVVYGLFGYIWLRGKFDPASGLFLHESTVIMMLVWFFLCLAGVIPRVANVVHAVGLGMGLAWGYLSSLRYR